MEANCSLPCWMTYVYPCFTSSPGPPIQYNRMNCVHYKGIVALTLSQESVPQTCLVYLKKTISHLGFLLLKCVKFKMKKSHKHNYIYYKLELKEQTTVPTFNTATWHNPFVHSIDLQVSISTHMFCIYIKNKTFVTICFKVLFHYSFSFIILGFTHTDLVRVLILLFACFYFFLSAWYVRVKKNLE